MDEILIWAGRYPEPKNNEHAKDGKIKLAKTPKGYYTDNLRSAVDLQLLKELHAHIAKHASLNQHHSKVAAENE